MKIDFHAHAFPDGLAAKAVASLQKGVRDADEGFDDTAFADGTVSGLAGLMDKSGVGYSVLLPVATKPSQPESINRWTEENFLHGGRVIPFGAVFPDENAPRVLEDLAQRGYKGIKLHGDFQGFHADDERMLGIYRRCGELGLITVMHAGFDCASPKDIHVTPERMANVLDKVSGTTFVLAHMGGIRCEERAARILAGAKDVYIDTAYTAGRIPPEDMRRYISAFGAERVLFASDSPWNDPGDVAELLEASMLTEEEKELIFEKNAVRLLGEEKVL